MRAFAFILATSLLFAPAAQAATPKRVASLKLCTDELLLLLAQPAQIASVTHLVQQPSESPLWRRARRYPRNDGSLLSVVGLAPDLVIYLGGGGRDGARIARRLGIRLLNLPYLESLDDLERAVRTLAEALGRPAAGHRLVAQIASLRRSAPRRKTDAIWLGGGGRSMSATGLGAEWMSLAGLRQRPLPGDRVTLELLIAEPPALLLRSDYRQGQYSADQRWLSHPLLERTRSARSIATDGRRWTCMGPLMIEEVLRLRNALGS